MRWATYISQESDFYEKRNCHRNAILFAVLFCSNTDKICVDVWFGYYSVRL